LFEKRYDFWKVNPTRIDLDPTYLQSELRIRDHVVLNENKKNCLKKIEGFVNSNCIREVLYVVKSSYQVSQGPKKIIKRYKN